jgi:HTH-type transcriptional regulator / antitoxin HipB
MENKKPSKIKTYEDLVDKQYGMPGTARRNAFEEKTQLFLIGDMLKDARKKAGLTQEQLAEKVGTKKSYISRLENGKGDIQLTTLFRIFEEGLGKHVTIFIED